MDLNESSEDDKTYEASSSDNGNLSSSSTVNSTSLSDLSLDSYHSQHNETCSDLILICSVCLEIQSDDNNEIIFCDKCGYTVHEDCYGVNATSYRDVASAFRLHNENYTSSNESDDPTELWFCERCVSDNCLPTACELCPNIDNAGLFKMTDQKRWVHIICALFNKYVAFHDTEILWPVDLSDIPQNNFGEKVCSYCEDIRMSRTGVCISCEVGLCQTSAHVGCAYRQGLIHYNAQSNEDSISFYCKQHTSEELVSQRLERIKTIDKFAHDIRNRKWNCDEMKRNERLLSMSKKHYAIRSANFTNPNQPTIKSRPITSSPLAMRLFLQKQNILENGLASSICEVADENINNEELSHEPAFTANFVNYFHARESELMHKTDRLRSLNDTLSKLHNQENELLTMLDEFEQLKTKHRALVTCVKRIFDAAKDIINSSDILQPCYDKLIAPVPLTTPSLTFISCKICANRHNQDTLLQCDMCQLSFHLGCLDPPLDRLPKQHRSYRWYCSVCSRANLNTTPEHTDNENGRQRKRRRVNRLS